MDIVWRKALPPIECSPNCWAKRPGTARAKAVPCTLQTPRPAIWARTLLCAAARESLLELRFPPNVWARARWPSAFLDKVMNLAQLFKLPVIYVCENNLYTEYTHYSETTAGDILTRATAFGLEAAAVDGQDVRAVHSIAQKLVARARKGDGP